MDTLPNEILLLIADECDLPARKSLASVNYNLRMLIWRNLPLLRSHRQKYTRVLQQIASIKYALIIIPNYYSKKMYGISLRVFGNKRSVYVSKYKYAHLRGTGYIECMCIRGNCRIIMTNKCKIKNGTRVSEPLISFYKYEYSLSFTIDTMLSNFSEYDPFVICNY